MSKIDEGKLIDGVIAVTEYLKAVSELSFKAHEKMAQVLKTWPVFETGTVTPEQNIPNFFPDPYAEMLRIEQGIGIYEVYPIKFLGTDNFKQISEIVRKLGGSYVHGDKAQGVKAHFTIPKEKQS